MRKLFFITLSVPSPAPMHQERRPLKTHKEPASRKERADSHFLQKRQHAARALMKASPNKVSAGEQVLVKLRIRPDLRCNHPAMAHQAGAGVTYYSPLTDIGELSGGAYAALLFHPPNLHPQWCPCGGDAPETQ